MDQLAIDTRIDEITTASGQRMAVRRIGPVDVHISAGNGKYPDGNYLVVRGRDSQASFDMPMCSRDLPASALGRDLVILSHVHEDHTAGLALLPAAPVYAHAGDVDAVRGMDGLARHYGYSPAVTREMCERTVSQFHFRPRPDAQSYVDGATWDLGGGVRVRAIHAPGHTSGHCILMVEPCALAFIADIDLTGFGPYYGDATSDLGALRRTLALVGELDAACWVTSHHRGVVHDRQTLDTLLGKFAAVVDRRDESIVTCLRGQPMTLDELVAHRFVYPHSFNDVFVDDVERRCISQHLDALLAQGRVSLADGVWAA